MNNEKILLGTPTAYQFCDDNGIAIEMVAKALSKSFLSVEDVQVFINTQSLAKNKSSKNQASKYWDIDHAAFGDIRIESVDNFSKITAENLSAAVQVIPSVTHGDNFSIQKINDFRQQVKEELKLQNRSLTLLPFIIKAMSKSLKKFPKINASLSADGEKLIYKNFIHIGVAMQTEYGLVVPVIRNVDKKNLLEIIDDLQNLTTLARSKKLKQEHLGGASITVTSLGKIAGLRFTPIINPPELAILGVSKTLIEPVWNGQEFLPEMKVPLDLSYDHRVINGVLASHFMTDIGNRISNPELILI